MLLSIFFVIVSLLGGGLLFFLIYPKLQSFAFRYGWTENSIFIMALSVTVVASMFGQISESVSGVVAKVLYYTFVFSLGFSLSAVAFLKER
ncbi:hypothetical protein [Bacillus halotolerans]|uniref:hypothetical protein n=1 Tax=Bacillus halotolerans TaxID=260554 RepID=UPI00273ABD11|nr:hypothetical protein [Bacillus halotolerans]MDP4527073.1 hypothetical protein [Bacillus halotolerans]